MEENQNGLKKAMEDAAFWTFLIFIVLFFSECSTRSVEDKKTTQAIESLESIQSKLLEEQKRTNELLLEQLNKSK